MAISITITADTQEEAIHQINGLADLVKQGANSLYFQKGTPRGGNAMTMVRADGGNDYVLGGLMDRKGAKKDLLTPEGEKAEGPQDVAETVTEAPQDAPKEKAKKSTPKDEKPAQGDSGAHSVKDVKPLLLLLAKHEHKDDVKEILSGFSAGNFKEFQKIVSERDDGAEMTERAYQLALAKVEEYDLKEE